MLAKGDIMMCELKGQMDKGHYIQEGRCRSEGIIEGRDDVEIRTLQKGGMMQEEGIIEGRDDAEVGYYRRDGCCQN